MKIILKLFLPLVIIINILFANDINLTQQEKEWIKNNSEVSIALMPDFTPFSYIANDHVVGFEHDILSLISKKSGLKFKKHFAIWNKNLNLFKNKQVDMISSISYKKERENFTLYTTAYYEIPIMIFTRDDFKDYKNINSLKGKKVGIMKDVFYTDELKKIDGLNLVFYETYDEVTKALVFGKIDALIQNLTNVNYLIKKNVYTNLKLAGELKLPGIKKEDLRFGINKDKPLLKSIIQKSLDAITAEEYNDIIVKWLGVKQNNNNQVSDIYLTKNEQIYLKKKKVIKICIDPSWMPFESFDTNKRHIGLTSEYFNIFSKKLDTKFVPIQTKTWAQSLQYAKMRKCDLLSLAMETKMRKEYMNFTKPYLSVPLAIVTKNDITYIENLKQLNNKKIGITKGYAFVDIIKSKYPNINLIEADNLDDGLKDVEKGNLFGYIDTLITFGQKLQIDYNNVLKISGKFDEKWELGIATRNDESILKDIMQKAIDSISEDKKQEILNKWISIKVEQKVDYKNLQYIVVVFLIFALFSLYFIKKLSKAKKDSQNLQKQLQIKSDYLENFFTTRAFGILIVDENRKILDVNPTFCKIWQYSYDEVVGQNAEYLHINHETYLRFGEIAFQKVQDKKPIDIDYQLKKKDGTIFWAKFSGEKINNSNNVLWVIEDITDLKDASLKLKKEKEQFEAIFNGSKDAIAILDMQSNFLEVNQAYIDMTGFTKEELLNTSCLSLTIPEDIKLSKQAMQEVLQVGYIKNFEKRCIVKNNSNMIINMSMSLLNNPDRILISVRDMSELKQKEQALIKSEQKAQQATKLKSEFLANMSHEIRTPMNGILGMLQLASKTNMDQKQKHYLNQVQQSANGLLNIINDILDFSKIEAGKLTINKVHFKMNDLLIDIDNLMRIKTDDKGLNYQGTCHCSKGVCNHFDNINVYYGDSLRIKQVLINLISNAIKFTDKGDVIVSIDHNPNNDIVQFEVKDTGIGLSKEQIDKLFQSFTQADGSTTRKYGGTGLGLSISKQLVELMGGKIWVESQLDVGSSFIFEIPLPKGDISKVEQKTTQDLDISTLKGSQILLTEDNPTNQEIILGLLENSGIKIDIASNGKEAVELYTNNKDKYELILMDLQMPIMDGYKATKQIRLLNKDIPIIALTANAMKEDVDRTQKVGMNEHLNKPIEVDKLYSTLLKYISKKIDNTEFQIKNKEDITIPNFINIDTKLGLSHMANNKNLYLKILNDFYNNYNNLDLKSLSEDEYKRTLHTLKGLSANIGATTLNKLAKELEENKTSIDTFKTELDKVLQELKNLELNTKNSTLNIELLTLSTNKRDELFDSLKEAINSKRIQRVKPIIEEIERYKLNSEDKELFDKVKKAVDGYDFNNAIHIMENV